MRASRPRSLPLVLALIALAGCARAPAGRTAAMASGTADVPIPRAVVAVRRLVRSHRTEEALALLEPGRPLTRARPERAWLLTLLLPGRCRSERARAAAAALSPACDLGAALRALVAEDPRRAVATLEARRPGDDEGWSALAAAHLHGRIGDNAAALRAARRAGASRRAFVRQEAFLIVGGLLRGAGELAGARSALREALALDPQDARAHRGLAEIHRRLGHADDAVLARWAAVEVAPDSEHYARELGEQLLEGASGAVVAALDRVLGEKPALGRANPELAAVRAYLAAERGRLPEALAGMDAALRAGAIGMPWEHHARRWLVRLGRYREAAARLEAMVPHEVVAHPTNLRRGHWEALRAAARAAPGADAPPEARLRLARAWVGVGALPEALAVAERLAGPDARSLAGRLRGHLAFEAALREHVEAGYRAALRQDEPRSFEASLETVRRLALRLLAPEDRAAFAVPDRAVRSIPFLGTWLDHRTDTTSPTVRHFRRYGRFLLFGQQAEGPPEAILLSIASLARARPICSVGRRYAHDVAIGYDRGSRAYLAAQGGGLGGACLADGIWLDVDTALYTELALRRALARSPGYARAVSASGPLAPAAPGGVTALSDPGCTAGRLVRRALARHPRDRWGSYWTLQAHEFGHVADIRRHLPILEGLPASLAILAREGFSPARVQMEFERRAQLGALVDARDPDLALAEMVLSLPVWEAEPEVHDGGYANGLRDLVAHIVAHPDRYPRIDRRRRIVTQLDRLTNAEIRAAARALLTR